MHQEYYRIRLERPGFGIFISGPSKTADIEQALVIGAHGARSCTLFLVGAQQDNTIRQIAFASSENDIRHDLKLHRRVGLSFFPMICR